MTNLEIRKEIDRLNKLIKYCLSPNEFTLNNTILQLSKEIEELQNKCTHNFIEGYCEYCNKSEED